MESYPHGHPRALTRVESVCLGKQVKRLDSHRAWYWVVFTGFVMQGVLYATWVSRTPEVQSALGLDTAGMGAFTLTLAIGSLTGMLIGGQLVHRFGVKSTLAVAYGLSSLFLVALGIATASGILGISFVTVFLLGSAMGSGGLSINIEGANVDRGSRKTLLPSLHGAFSAGTLLGGAIGTLAIVAHVSVWGQFLAIGALCFLVNALLAFLMPRDELLTTTAVPVSDTDRSKPTRAERASVWREPRTMTVAFIVLGFNLAEGTASTWLPIAMVDIGMTEAFATATYTTFAAAMTITRFSGGMVVDRIGKQRSLLLFASTTVIGILTVIATPLIALPLVGAFLWGAGNSMGFPLCVSVISDEPRLSASRVGVLALSSNAAGLVGPPLLGGLGQLWGLLTAFYAPALLLGSGMAMNPRLKAQTARIEQANL